MGMQHQQQRMRKNSFPLLFLIFFFLGEKQGPVERTIVLRRARFIGTIVSFCPPVAVDHIWDQTGDSSSCHCGKCVLQSDCRGPEGSPSTYWEPLL
ncbi:hypothetical protein BDV11DRAFT_179526 [Aspergillus similis]